MNSLSRLKLAWILSSSAFWISVVIPFFNSKSIQSDQVFGIISVYYLFIVLLEYPTGVIGDYFSHKLSVSLGFIISCIALSITVFELPMILYYFALFLLALGASLVSGSNEALLYKLSDDFKRDLVNINSVVQIFVLISVTAGGFLGSININIPVILDALGYFMAFLLMLGIKETSGYVSKSIDDNIFSFALGGLKSLISNKKLV